MMFLKMSYEVIKNGIKSCFERVAFQDAVIMSYLCVVFLIYRDYPERI